MRNHCSELKQDLFNNHVSDSPICNNCDLHSSEDALHFFFVCPKYNMIRNHLITNVPNQVDIILFGSVDSNFEENKININFVHEYIDASKRFT